RSSIFGSCWHKSMWAFQAKELSMIELKPCPWCNSSVSFHEDGDYCRGCHNIICSGCKAFVDLSSVADPDDNCDTLDDLRTQIAIKWNHRSPVSETGIQRAGGYARQ